LVCQEPELLFYYLGSSGEIACFFRVNLLKLPEIKPKMPKQKQTRSPGFWSRVLTAGLLFVTISLAGLVFADFVFAKTLSLPSSVADNIGVPKMADYAATDNADLISLLKKDDGIIGKILNILRYTLGAVFMVYLGIYIIHLITSAGNDEAVTEFKNEMVYALVGFLILGLAKSIADTFSIIQINDIGDVSNGNFVTNPEALKSSVELGGYTVRAAAKMLQYLLGSVALLFMGTAAFRMITAEGDEEAVKNSRKSIVWASFGLLSAGVVSLIVDGIAAPTDGSGILVDLSAVDPAQQHAAVLELGRLASRSAILDQVKYFQTFVAATAVLMLFLAGFKMVTAAGNDEIVTKQKKMITWVFMGLATVLISEAFVNIFMPEQAGQIVVPGVEQIGSFADQVGGFTNFLLTFTGGLAVLALVVGALYFTTAVANPEQAENGKKILLGAALGLVLTISAYAVVNTILSGQAVTPDASISISN
jgi:hypothetical protein